MEDLPKHIGIEARKTKPKAIARTAKNLFARNIFNKMQIDLSQYYFCFNVIIGGVIGIVMLQGHTCANMAKAYQCPYL